MRKRLVDLANAGLPLSEILVIDGHAHMGPYWNFRIPFNGPAGMIRSMDALGIDIACISPHLSIGPDAHRGNMAAIEAANSYPNRFVCAISVNPNYPGEVRTQIGLLSDPSVKAFKLHPSLHEYPADGDAYRIVYEAAARHRVPVMIHTWVGDQRCQPSMFSKLAKEFPETSFVLIHSGGVEKKIGEAIAVAKECENVYLDTTGSTTFRIVEKMVEEVGSDRILFGSDQPFIDPAAQVGKIVYAHIPEEDKVRILGLNAKRLLRL